MRTIVIRANTPDNCGNMYSEDALKDMAKESNGSLEFCHQSKALFIPIDLFNLEVNVNVIESHNEEHVTVIDRAKLESISFESI